MPARRLTVALTAHNRTVLQLFVKGVVNQEEQQEVPYPAVLHCVFCGARGLFIDSLVRNTSAQIVVSLRELTVLPSALSRNKLDVSIFP